MMTIVIMIVIVIVMMVVIVIVIMKNDKKRSSKLLLHVHAADGRCKFLGLSFRPWLPLLPRGSMVAEFLSALPSFLVKCI